MMGFTTKAKKQTVALLAHTYTEEASHVDIGRGLSNCVYMYTYVTDEPVIAPLSGPLAARRVVDHAEAVALAVRERTLVAVAVREVVLPVAGKLAKTKYAIYWELKLSSFLPLRQRMSRRTCPEPWGRSLHNKT